MIKADLEGNLIYVRFKVHKCLAVFTRHQLYQIKPNNRFSLLKTFYSSHAFMGNIGKTVNTQLLSTYFKENDFKHFTSSRLLFEAKCSLLSGETLENFNIVFLKIQRTFEQLKLSV